MTAIVFFSFVYYLCVIRPRRERERVLKAVKWKIELLKEPLNAAPQIFKYIIEHMDDYGIEEIELGFGDFKALSNFALSSHDQHLKILVSECDAAQKEFKERLEAYDHSMHITSPYQQVPLITLEELANLGARYKQCVEYLRIAQHEHREFKDYINELTAP
ncbi:MAG TPA: hypothetical protein VL335_01180 [Candidatus Paceibacterota bacterium]|jgi:hypothetical protein|nr:hypothetical protein [Candidatus Paceibacterota bacterium]